MIARVLIDLKVEALNRLFDYYIPSEISDLKVGMRVVVPFGKQKRMAYVIELVEKSTFAERTIIEALDVVPSLSSESIEYIKYLQENNYNLLINIIETIIPSELFLKYDQELEVLNYELLDEELKSIFKNKNKVIVDKRIREKQSLVNKEIAKKNLRMNQVYKQKGNLKYQQVINYVSRNNYKNFYKYEDLIFYVKNNENLTRKQIVENGFSLSSINTLIKNEVFKIDEVSINRDVKFVETSKIELHKLNDEQEFAYKKIKDNISKNNIYLLKGITGSGKTEVYMKVMKDVLNKNKKVLFLVPEITLIAPLIQNLRSRFNEEIVHYNSNISQGERYDSWYKIINNDAKIIVGTRSSVFLPINDLGLIVVDEEHDKSYLQTDKVQYDLIDIVKIKSKLSNCPVILGSATPRISSMYFALNGKYTLLELKKRASLQPLPKISFVDMKNELKNGNTKIFSKQLFDSIEERLNNNEQTILLYNRKGYAPFVMCRTCGYTPKCKNCDVSLTYYKDENELRCSYCGYHEKNTDICPSCNNKTMRPVGVGIEYVEAEVKKYFKNARVIRMDSQTTTKKGSHEKIWLDFKEHKYDILIGTQMVSKGLDFPKVSLVGILMADLELRVPNYLASEHTYALLTQMSGRSGRNILGEAIIQGYDLDHYAIKNVGKEYNEFYKEALYNRKISKYYPFYDVGQVIITNKSYLIAYQDAFNLKKELEKSFSVVLGPTETLIKYIKNEFRFLITIKDKKIKKEIIFKLMKKNENNSKMRYLSIPEII